MVTLVGHFQNCASNSGGLSFIDKMLKRHICQSSNMRVWFWYSFNKTSTWKNLISSFTINFHYVVLCLELLLFLCSVAEQLLEHSEHCDFPSFLMVYFYSDRLHCVSQPENVRQSMTFFRKWKLQTLILYQTTSICLIVDVLWNECKLRVWYLARCHFLVISLWCRIQDYNA